MDRGERCGAEGGRRHDPVPRIRAERSEDRIRARGHLERRHDAPRLHLVRGVVIGVDRGVDDVHRPMVAARAGSAAPAARMA